MADERSTTPRDPFFDFFKGALILLVTIGHAVQFIMYGCSEFWDDPVYKAIYLFHMPLFAVVGGFLAYRGLLSRSVSGTLWTKARAYLVPVLVWAVLFRSAVWLIEPHHTLGEQVVLFVKECTGRLWFFWAMFLGCALVACALRLPIPLRHAAWLSVMCFVALPDINVTPMLKFTVPFFVGGFLAARGRDRGASVPGMLVPLALAGLVVSYLRWDISAYVYISQMPYTGNWGNILLRYFAGACGSLVVWHALRKVFPLVCGGLRRQFTLLGNASLQIYILHIYALSVFAPKLGAASGFLRSHPAAGYLVALPAGALIAWIGLWTARLIARAPLLNAVLFGRSPRAVEPRTEQPADIATR